MAWILGILCAVLLHAGFLLFGGLIFPKAKEDKGTLQQVELLSEDDTTEEDEKKPEEEKPADPEELQTDEEDVPDPEQIARSLEVSPVNDAPALDAASLSAIEQALSGQTSDGGDFADAVSFASGGRIGGTGRGGAGFGGAGDADFDMTGIDQKPRPTFRAEPMYPKELNGKKITGYVTLIFRVDENGAVTNVQVKDASHPAFEKPAIAAIKQWKFEPGIRGGKRANCPARQTIRFQSN